MDFRPQDDNARRPAVRDLEGSLVRNWRDYLAWAGVVAIILVQFCIFRSYALREVTWLYPTASDQTVYLSLAYTNFEKILSNGFVEGVWASLTTPAQNGVMLPTQAAILFVVFGPSRLTALSLSFLYLALAECVLMWVMHWLTRSWAVAFTALALILLSSSRFFYAGGIFDFRIDSVAASLYGVLICLVIRSRLFASLPLSIAAGFTGAILVLFRFVAAAYVGALLGISVVVIAILFFRVRNLIPEGVLVRNRLIHSAIALGIVVALVSPVLFHSAPVILQYYGHHVIGPERAIRQAEFGLTSIGSHLAYYPKSLWSDHLGPAYLIGFVVVVGLSVYWRIRLRRFGPNAGNPESGHEMLQWYVAFVGAALLIPLAMLMTDEIKTPVVGGLFLFPLTTLICCLAIFGVEGSMRSSRTASIVAAALVAAAVGHEFTATAHRSPFIRNREEGRSVLQVYDEMAKYAADAGWRAPAIAVDRIDDYQAAGVFSVRAYEQTGVWYPASLVLGGSIFHISHDEALASLDRSDFAMLTLGPSPGDATAVYPFDRDMIGMRNELMEHLKGRFVLLRDFTFSGHRVGVFARPAVKLVGESGGWLTSDGASLVMPCRLVAGKQSLVASGDTIFPDLLKNQLQVRAKLAPDGSVDAGFPVPATVGPVGPSYTIRFDLTKAEPPASGDCAISLSFDRYFVPREHGINSDTRKLVIMRPTRFQFQ